MMRRMTGYEKAEGKCIQRTPVSLPYELQLLFCKIAEEIFRGAACRFEFLQQVFPMAAGCSGMDRPVILVKAGKRSEVQPGKAKGAVTEYPFRVYDILQHFADGPFPRGVSMINFFRWDLFQEFSELPGIFFYRRIDVFFFYEIQVGLIEFSGD